MNRTLALYLLGFFTVALAIAIPFLSWLSPLTFIVIFPLGVLWIWKSEGRSLWDLGYRFSSGWFSYLAIGLLFGLAIPVLFQIVQVLGGWITLTPRGEPVTDWISSFPLVLLKMICIVAIEEFVSRGFFLQALSRKVGIRWAAVMSSLLWGIGHLASMVAAGLAPGLIIIGMTTFLLWGITLSLSYVKANKSLWLPYGLHLGINLSFSFSVIGLFFITEPNAPQWWIGHPAWSPESGLIGVIVWLILALIIYCITGKEAINRFTAN
jgi:membrane protease YdiL (CAAX protease family)